MDRRIGLGIGNGVAAGALWGTVVLAPQLLPGFTAVRLVAGVIGCASAHRSPGTQAP